MGEDALFRQRYSHKDEWKGIGMRLHHQPRPHSANHDAGSALRIRGLGMSLAYPVVDRWAGRWLGSDFDGSRTPTGMEDCSKVPWITEEMLNRGYSDEDTKKVLGLNVLRVLEAVVGAC